MSLHAQPKTRAEQFALHLEMKYGLQLDLPRSTALVAELQEFANPTDPFVNPRDPFAPRDPAVVVVSPIDKTVAAPPFPTDAFVKPADTPVTTEPVVYPSDPFAKRADAPVAPEGEGSSSLYGLPEGVDARKIVPIAPFSNAPESPKLESSLAGMAFPGEGDVAQVSAPRRRAVTYPAEPFAKTDAPYPDAAAEGGPDAD